MKKIIAIVLIALCGSIAKSQHLASKRPSTIKAFISAVLKKKPAGFVISKFMYLPPNDTVPMTKREFAIAAMQDSLVKAKGQILASSNYMISKYDEFKGSKKRFNTDNNKDILILSVEDKPLVYFYFKEDRIMSFYYISKGDLSFFVVI